VVHSPTDTPASLGDRRIANQVKRVSYRIRSRDLQDLLQQVYLELLQVLGADFRERIGFLGSEGFQLSYENAVLVRCVDRVARRFQRVKSVQSIDQLKEDRGYTPVDPQSCKDGSLLRMMILLELQRDLLDPREQSILQLRLAEVPLDETLRRLGLGRTKYYQLRRELFGKLARLLRGDD
jgi:hypothetical protein